MYIHSVYDTLRTYCNYTHGGLPYNNDEGIFHHPMVGGGNIKKDHYIVGERKIHFLHAERNKTSDAYIVYLLLFRKDETLLATLR